MLRAELLIHRYASEVSRSLVLQGESCIETVWFSPTKRHLNLDHPGPRHASGVDGPESIKLVGCECTETKTALPDVVGGGKGRVPVAGQDLSDQ